MSQAAEEEVTKFMSGLVKRNPHEPEFHQAVHEVVETLMPSCFISRSSNHAASR